MPPSSISSFGEPPLKARLGPLGTNSEYWFTEDNIVVIHLVRLLPGLLLIGVAFLGYILTFSALYSATGEPEAAIIPGIALFFLVPYVLGYGILRIIASRKLKRASKMAPGSMERAKGIKCIPWAEVEQINIDRRDIFIRTGQGMFRGTIAKGEVGELTDFLQSKVGPKLIAGWTRSRLQQ